MSAHEMKGKYTIFVFIDTTPGEDETVMEKLLKHDEVIEVHLISGQYDLFAVLEISLFGKAIFFDIRETAMKSVEKIRKLSHVRDTNTIVPFFSVTKRAE